MRQRARGKKLEQACATRYLDCPVRVWSRRSLDCFGGDLLDARHIERLRVRVNDSNLSVLQCNEVLGVACECSRFARDEHATLSDSDQDGATILCDDHMVRVLAIHDSQSPCSLQSAAVVSE